MRAYHRAVEELHHMRGLASLPGLLGSETDVTPKDVFAAMELQRLRLRQDQQVPEWSGTATVPKTTPGDALVHWPYDHR